MAEYRGVAVVRIGKSVAQALHSGDLQKAGRICVLRRMRLENAFELIDFETEADGKRFLDTRSRHDLLDFHSLRDVAEMSTLDEKERRSLCQLRWEWDEEQQSFVDVLKREDAVGEWGIGKTGLELRSHPQNPSSAGT